MSVVSQKREWKKGSPGAGSVSGENEDKGGEEEQASFKWKWVRGVSENRQNGSDRLAVIVYVSGSGVGLCTFCLASKNMFLPVSLHRVILEKQVWEEERSEKKGVNRKSRQVTKGEKGYLTRRWALRESLPPTEVTLHVYVPMSPDQVWEMWRVPSGSSRRRGVDWTLIAEPSFSHTCLKHKVTSKMSWCWYCPSSA